MNSELGFKLKVLRLSHILRERAYWITWRYPTTPTPGDTVAAQSRDPSSAPGHLSLSDLLLMTISPHLASLQSGKRLMVRNKEIEYIQN